MAKASEGLPRRRGRPKSDDATLLLNVLVQWLQIGDPGRRGLYRAVRRIIPKEKAGCKALRERINRALDDMGREQRLRCAIDATEQRGAVAPEWARAELVDIERQNREWEAALAAELNSINAKLRLASVANAVLIERQVTALQHEYDHLRRWVLFSKVMGHIFSGNTRASVITRAFTRAEEIARQEAQAARGCPIPRQHSEQP